MPPRLVPPLAAGTPGDPGLTGPGSVTWRVSRERVVPLGGLSALLLQLSHPLVAAGVFYLILTIPLTHLVNFVDNRLRHGRGAAGEPEDPLALASSQEML